MSETITLGDLADLIDYGVTASAVESPVGPKFLRISDIQDNSVNWNNVPWCECSAKEAENSKLANGDIVFARTGATTGKSFLIEDCPSETVFASYLIRVRVNDRLSARYLAHFFQTPNYWAQITKSARGVAQPGVNSTTLKQLRVPVPSLDEQKRIAEVLDRAEALRAQRRAALALLDELTQSIFLDMFGDPVFNPYGFERKTLAEACRSPDDIKCGPFGTQLNKSEFREQGIPLWGIKNVNRNFELPTLEFLEPHTAKRLSQYSIVPGDIVMTRKGTVGNCAVYPEDFSPGVMHSDLLRVRVDIEKCSPDFLSHQLHFSRDVERQLALLSGGAVMPGINVTRLKKLEVLIPPTTLQREFGLRLGKVRAIRSSVKDSLNQLDKLFASLQNSAFKGELFEPTYESVTVE